MSPPQVVNRILEEDRAAAVPLDFADDTGDGAAVGTSHDPNNDYPDGDGDGLLASTTATSASVTNGNDNDSSILIRQRSSSPSPPNNNIKGRFGSFYENHCHYFPAMAGWFTFSALLSSYNKFVFGNGHLAFPCPLLLTSIHFGIQWIFSTALCYIWPVTFGGDRIQTMSWKQWASVSVPCGLVTSGDIGLSNLSLVSISITFYTMVKSSTPVFVLGWAYLFGIERITWSLILVVAVIAAGEFLTVVGEVDFSLTGFLMCLSASMLSGARWTLVQLKIQSLDPPLKTTIATMKVLAPSMFISMLLLSFIIEHPWDRFGTWTPGEVWHIIGLGLLGAAFAIAMILCEFHLIMYASAVILMIGGVIKEVITIFVGVMYFKDDLNRINLAGCFVVFLGVVLYKVTYHLNKHGGNNGSSTGADHHHRHDKGMSRPERGRGVIARANSIVNNNNGAYHTIDAAGSGEDPIDMIADEESSKGLQLSEGVVEHRRPTTAAKRSSGSLEQRIRPTTTSKRSSSSSQENGLVVNSDGVLT